jgi:signal transduction histidine kinase
MYDRFNAIIDWFIPESLKTSHSDLVLARNFVLLHLLGPLMGQSVTIYLWATMTGNHWQIWVLEAVVTSFFFIPFYLRQTGNMKLCAMISVQSLVGASFFGSFYFGGISSPLLPWFLIALVLGFFYLADSTRAVLATIGVQLVCFVAAWLWFGAFPVLIDTDELIVPNLFSIVSAFTYMTVLCLFYETVMRASLRLERETIDQQSRIEYMREAMQAAEQASQAKSIFLAKMSHELRTPLNAVIGYTEMLREAWEERGEDERKAQDLGRIHAAGRHLLALVTDVIDLSSVEADKIELSLEPVALNDLLAEVVATATPLTRKRDNHLLLNVPHHPGSYMLDPLKLRQSLLNLLSNAAKFTTKGTIMLSVLQTVESGEQWLTFEVTDTGVGMRPEALERIFETFSQADEETVTQFGGTGLGLTLTKRFVEMMDGQISVRSDHGIGSGFTIRIPVTPVALDVDPVQTIAA